MVAILPVVIGTLAALYVSFMNPAVPTGLQELSTVAISGIGSVGATVYALQAVVRGHRHANLRGAFQFMTPSLYSFNRQVLATLPSVLGVLDEIAPSSGLLALAATNVLTSSEVVAPYIGGVLDTLALIEAKAQMWVEPRAVDFDLEPWFEWQPAPEAGDSILCGQDEMNFRLTCYRLPRPVSRFVRSLDVYRPDATSLTVFNPTLSLPTCLDLEVSYLHRSSIRSAAIFGQENRVLTIMGRVILVQPYPLQVSLACSGSNAACSLDIYRRDSPRRSYLYDLLAHFYSSVSFLAFQWARSILVCALVAISILTIGNLVHRSLAVTDVASNAVRAPTQAVYRLARNAQDEEPGCWSLIPLALDAKYNGFEHDQGPDDDVSGICASGSHCVVDTVADPLSSVTITAPGTPEAESEDSDSTTTHSTDPASVPLPDSEDDDFGPAEDATTVALAVDPATIPLPPDDGLWDTDAELEFPSYSDQSDSILSADLDSSDSLVSDVQTEESSGLGSLSMSEDQLAEFGDAPRFLVEDGTGGASVSASTSLNSDILGELGDAAQEGPAGDAWDDNGNTGAGASTSLDMPRPNTPPIEAAGTSELPTDDSLDLNLIIESRSQLLDVDLKDLADSGSKLVPDVDWDEEKMVAAKPNAPVSSLLTTLSTLIDGTRLADHRTPSQFWI
ncbi:hypothetical protein FRC08_004646 [Ceratobasidium sp. 394]|nr:hypothetical protein FRC08_004646 [Ceratobasidium sp. 394]